MSRVSGKHEVTIPVAVLRQAVGSAPRKTWWAMARYGDGGRDQEMLCW